MTKNHSIARRDHLRRRVRMTTVGATGLAGAASVALTFALAGPASHIAEATTPSGYSPSAHTPASAPGTTPPVPRVAAPTSTQVRKPAPVAPRPAAAPAAPTRAAADPHTAAAVAPPTTVDPGTAPVPVLSIPVQQPVANPGQAHAPSGGS